VLNGHLLWVKNSINDVNYETTEEPSSSLAFFLPFIFHLLLSLTFPGRKKEIERKFASLPFLSYKNNAQDELKVVVSLDTSCGCDVRLTGIWELSAAIHLSRLKTHHHHHITT
jgi:hypothetical protein